MRKIILIFAVLFVCVFLIGEVKAEDCYVWNEADLNYQGICSQNTDGYDDSADYLWDGARWSSYFAHYTNCICVGDMLNFTACTYDSEVTTGGLEFSFVGVKKTIQTNNLGDSSKCNICGTSKLDPDVQNQDLMSRSLVISSTSNALCNPPQGTTNIIDECRKKEWFTLFGDYNMQIGDWRTVNPCLIRSTDYTGSISPVCSVIGKKMQSQTDTPQTDTTPEIITVTKESNYGEPCCLDQDGDGHQKQEYHYDNVCGAFNSGDCEDGPEVIRKESGVNNLDDVHARIIAKEVSRGCQMQPTSISLDFSANYKQKLTDNGVIVDKFMEREIIGKFEDCSQDGDTNGDGYNAADQPNCHDNFNPLQYPMMIHEDLGSNPGPSNDIGFLTAVDGSELECEVNFSSEPEFWNAPLNQQKIKFKIYVEENPSFLQTVRELYLNLFQKPSTSSPDIQNRFAGGGAKAVFSWLGPKVDKSRVLDNFGDSIAGITCSLIQDADNMGQKKISCKTKFTVPSGWRGKWVMCAAYPYMNKEDSLYFRQKAQFSEPIGVAARASVWIPRKVMAEIPGFSLKLINKELPDKIYKIPGLPLVKWLAPPIEDMVTEQVNGYFNIGDSLSAVQWFDKQVFITDVWGSKQNFIEAKLAPSFVIATNQNNVFEIKHLGYNFSENPEIYLLELPGWIKFKSDKDRQVFWVDLGFNYPPFFDGSKLDSYKANGNIFIKVSKDLEITIENFEKSYTYIFGSVLLINKQSRQIFGESDKFVYAHEKGHSDFGLCDEYSRALWKIGEKINKLKGYNSGCPNPYPECCGKVNTICFDSEHDVCRGMPYYPDYNTPDSIGNCVKESNCFGQSVMTYSMSGASRIYPTLTSKQSYCQLRSKDWGECQLEGGE